MSFFTFDTHNTHTHTHTHNYKNILYTAFYMLHRANIIYSND